MKSKYKIIISVTAVLTLIIGFNSCKRSSIEQPSPVGPSNFAVVLRVVASPNVLYSSTSQQKTTLTATLTKYNGIPISDRTVTFDIRNEMGIKLSLGHFEDNQPVISKVTDSNGIVRVDYFGPLAKDLRDEYGNENTTIYIYAYVSWDAKEFIQEIAPIYLIQQVSDLVLDAVAFPDVLYAGNTLRKNSTITATVKISGDVPLSNHPINFEITDENGAKLNVGYFQGHKMVISRNTNEEGTARVDYFGPLAQEIADNLNVFIKVSISGIDEEQAVTTLVPIQVIREVTEWTMYLSSQPNVLFAGDTRESSLITAILTAAGGISVANQPIYFEVTDDQGNKLNVGFFEGNVPAIKKSTNKAGEVSVTYFGPIASEITDNITLYMKATLAGEGSDIISVLTPIYIIRDVTDVFFDLFADPNILWATSGRPHSKITAVFRKIDGTPFINKEIYFAVLSGPGEFGNGKNKAVAKTDSTGTASVTYYGPTKKQITGTYVDVVIQGQPQTKTPNYIHKEIDIRIRKGN
ncbi:MAG: hypothetical protein JW755_04960 [Candidatus Aminicenantes bacterium]|nr:hypothetical protein [Candidatus Aminicenantes bacterium]